MATEDKTDQEEAEDETDPHGRGFIHADNLETKATAEQKEAYAQMEVHLAAAQACLDEAEKLAKAHKLSFHFGINTYNDPFNEWSEGGWAHSAVC